MADEQTVETPEVQEVTPEENPVVIDPLKIQEELTIMKNHNEQLKNSQAGETRKNTELMKRIGDLEGQINIIKTSQMTDEEKRLHEISQLKEEIARRDDEIKRIEFLDKVKEACSSAIIKHELSPEDYDFIYDENIEVMDKKAQSLKERDSKIIERTKSELRGSTDTGRPGTGNAQLDSSSPQGISAQMAKYRDIEAKQGKGAANTWLKQSKLT